MRWTRGTFLMLVIVCICIQPVSASQPQLSTQSTISNSVEEPVFATTTTSYSQSLPSGSPSELKTWGGDRGTLNTVTYQGKRGVETAREDGTNYIYLDILRGSPKPLDRSARVTISIEYWNGQDGAFRLEYDGYGDFAADTSVVEMTGSGGWQTATFSLTNARFTERLNNGDFRVNPLNGPSNIAIRNVSVRVDRPKLVMDQVTLGNVFLSNETPQIRLEGYGAPVSWTLRHYNGSVAQNETLDAPGSDGQIVTFDVDGIGHYRVEFRDSKTGEPLRETSFAVLPNSSNGGYTRYGVSTHYGQLNNRDIYRLETMDLLTRAGVGTLRDNIAWNDVETERDEYNFHPRHDAYMASADARGIEPSVILAGTNDLYDDGTTVHTDTGREGFAQYSRAVVNRYDGLQYVEVYNEFNIRRFGDVGDGPADARPESYSRLLNATAYSLNDSDVKLVGPATSGVPYDWLETVFSQGGAQRLDVVSVHPYAGDPNEVDEEMKRTTEISTEAGGPDQVWVSENGWPTSTQRGGISFEDNANYLVQAHVLAFSEGTQRYYTYELIDQAPDRAAPESNFGLVHTRNDIQGSYTPKPAYTALGILTSTVGAKPYQGEDRFSSPIESHRFGEPGDKETVRVIWRPVPTTSTVTVETDSPVTVRTIMGGQQTRSPTDGTIHLNIGPEPIYVFGLGADAVSEYQPPTETDESTPSPTVTPSPTPTESRQTVAASNTQTETSGPGLGFVVSGTALIGILTACHFLSRTD